MSFRSLQSALVAFCSLAACNKAEEPQDVIEGTVIRSEPEAPSKAASPSSSEPSPAEPRPLRRDPLTPDPESGDFTLAEATAGLPEGTDPLYATIRTDLGRLTCKLFADKAPRTVANFVGLARGKRPFWDARASDWVRRAAYDGTAFHRVIPGFMIQGGDHLGDGSGSPGYTVPDEVWDGARHDRAGLLCMANRGPNTNGAQFFITDASAPHLDESYTIFGECSPTSIVSQIARVPQTGRPRNRPLTAVQILSVRISRGAPPPPQPPPRPEPLGREKRPTPSTGAPYADPAR